MGKGKVGQATQLVGKEVLRRQSQEGKQAAAFRFPNKQKWQTWSDFLLRNWPMQWHHHWHIYKLGSDIPKNIKGPFRNIIFNVRKEWDNIYINERTTNAERYQAQRRDKAQDVR